MVLDAHAERVDEDGEEYALLEVLVVDEPLRPLLGAAHRADEAAAAGLEQSAGPRAPHPAQQASPADLPLLRPLHLTAARARVGCLATGRRLQPLRSLLQRYVPLTYTCATGFRYTLTLIQLLFVGGLQFGREELHFYIFLCKNNLVLS